LALYAFSEPVAVDDMTKVFELAVHPAESRKLAARHKLVEIAEACRKESDVGRRTTLSTVDELAGIQPQSNLWKR